MGEDLPDHSRVPFRNRFGMVDVIHDIDRDQPP